MKNIANRIVGLLLTAFILSACSDSGTTDGSSLFFSLDKSMTQKISAAAKSLTESELSGLYLEVCLKGEYEESKTVAVTETEVVNFDGIPVGAKIYAEATAYMADEDSEDRAVLYKGKSDIFTVQAGTNKVEINLTKQTASIELSLSTTEEASDIEGYEIRIRDSNGEIQKTLEIKSIDSPILLDGMTSGTYTVSALAYKTASGDDGNSSDPQTFTYDAVMYYGAETIELLAGVKKSASLEMGTFNDTGTYPVVTIVPPTGAFEDGSILEYSCTVTGSNVNFTYTGSETTYEGKEYGTMNPSYLDGIANYYWNQKKETFLEPGFDYTFSVTVIKNGWEGDEWTTFATYTGSTTTTIEQSNYGNQGSHAITVKVE